VQPAQDDGDDSVPAILDSGCVFYDSTRTVKEETMSVYDDGSDIGKAPDGPVTETRGGENIDWARARPGEPLPEKPPEGDDDAGGDAI